MPLLDHFHPPVQDELPWASFYSFWVTKVAGWLNATLPRDEYRAFANLHLGPQVAADVAEFETSDEHRSSDRNRAVATLPDAPPAHAVLPAVFADEIEVQVSETYRSFRLLGVIEFVSPANKKEATERAAFLAKCVAYLRQGVGLVIVDAVTSRHTNFHNQLLRELGGGTASALPDKQPIYATSYRPVHRRGDGRDEIEVWSYPLTVGQPIPAVPFGLRRGPTLSLDLEGTYTAALADSGL